MPRRKSGSIDRDILIRLSKMYSILSDKVKSGKDGNYNSRSDEDVFEDTIIAVASDTISAELSDVGLMSYFIKRYKQIRYTNIKEHYSRREESDAENIQDKKESEKED